jgi:hypothetical protein
MQGNVEIHVKIHQGCSNKTCSRGFFSKAAQPCYRTFYSSYFFFFFLEILALKMNGAYAVPDLEPTLLDSNFTS